MNDVLTLGILLTFSLLSPANGCEELFDGFGVYLGSMHHLRDSPAVILPKVFERAYNDLGLRYFRTSYEPSFSPSRDVYEIKCENAPNSICTYIEIHKEIAKYENISVIASIWSPPLYMKNNELSTLLRSEERNYYYFIKNITQLMKDQFNITIEKVSPVNEPENVFATWEHTNMDPIQLCRIVNDFNDSLTSLCPENSYFWISEGYAAPCLGSCQVFATHAYYLNVGGEDNLSAYYDRSRYARKVAGIPIWQTEVSSTFGRANQRQMEEALDMAINVANFVGHTCIQRYYFWLAYTLEDSGESLMWGHHDGNLTFPKKYFAYKHFTQAAFGGQKRVTKCGPGELIEIQCLKFGNDKAVFVNSMNLSVPVFWDNELYCSSGTFCCTTGDEDWDCTVRYGNLPPGSICSCILDKKPADDIPHCPAYACHLQSSWAIILLILMSFIRNV